MCGENAMRNSSSVAPWGSPPRVRGKLGSFDEITFSTRITPACAGKTSAKVFLTRNIKDHPRVCGENRERFRKENEQKGSPPRVRGKQVLMGEC